MVVVLVVVLVVVPEVVVLDVLVVEVGDRIIAVRTEQVSGEIGPATGDQWSPLTRARVRGNIIGDCNLFVNNEPLHICITHLNWDVVIYSESAIVKGLFTWGAVARWVKIPGNPIRVWCTVVHNLLELSFLPTIEEVSVKVPSTVSSRNSVTIGENIVEVSTAIIWNPNEDLHLRQPSLVS